MPNTTRLNVELDVSIKDSQIFNSVSDFSFKKIDIFKNGVLNMSLPANKIGENDFEYLQSKVPDLYNTYEDYISLDDDTIYNLGQSEMAILMSEYIGVGVGVSYVLKLFNIIPNQIKKIPPPPGKEKYLDFSFIKDNREYEYECKGTTNDPTVITMLQDIKDKKANKPNTACRFGTVVLARKHGETNRSRFIVCDENTKKLVYEQYDIYHYLDYYRFVLSLILDNPQYNKLVRQINKKKITTNSIEINRVKGRYLFDGKVYIGQYFDKRLILKKIMEFYDEGLRLDSLFNKLTKNIGKEKYFLGINEATITALHKLDIEKLNTFLERKTFETEDIVLISDSDGIFFVRSRNGADKQIEENFTEDDVKARIGMILNFTRGERQMCGAPCRSREKSGKPCEIMTYRGNCHFHR